MFRRLGLIGKKRCRPDVTMDETDNDNDNDHGAKEATKSATEAQQTHATTEKGTTAAESKEGTTATEAQQTHATPEKGTAAGAPQTTEKKVAVAKGKAKAKAKGAAKAEAKATKRAKTTIEPGRITQEEEFVAVGTSLEGNKVRVGIYQDHQELVRIFVDSKGKCSCATKHPLSQKSAFDICFKVAKEYVFGNLKIGEMKARKDELVNELVNVAE